MKLISNLWLSEVFFFLVFKGIIHAQLWRLIHRMWRLIPWGTEIYLKSWTDTHGGDWVPNIVTKGSRYLLIIPHDYVGYSLVKLNSNLPCLKFKICFWLFVNWQLDIVTICIQFQDTLRSKSGIPLTVIVKLLSSWRLLMYHNHYNVH